MKKIVVLLVFTLLGCNSFKVVTDYEDNINFSKYKAYNFFKNSGENLSDFDKKRLQNAIEIELENNGFTFAENPDFFIDFNLQFSELQNTNTIGIGIGSGGRNGGFGISGGIPVGGKKMIANILVEFLTADKEMLFWQGSLDAKVKEKMTPQEKEIHYNKMVQQILLEYPPNKKTSLKK